MQQHKLSYNLIWFDPYMKKLRKNWRHYNFSWYLTSNEKLAWKNCNIRKKLAHDNFWKKWQTSGKIQQANFDPHKIPILFFLLICLCRYWRERGKALTVIKMTKPVIEGLNHCFHRHQKIYWSGNQGHCRNHDCIPRRPVPLYIYFTIQYPL